MKKQLLICCALFFTFVIVFKPVIATSCTVTVLPGGDIQAAISGANPGDVICLSPGIYTPATTITINKSITLQGPQADTDPRPSAGSSRVSGSASEAIIDGTLIDNNFVILISENDVEINGIEVRSPNKNDLMDMIKQNSVYSGTKVRYCIIHDGRGDEGVQLSKCTNGIIEHNYVYDIKAPGDAINYSDGTYGTIRCNEVKNIGSENAAIYCYGVEHIDIIENLIDTTTQNDGIKVGDKHGADYNKNGALIRNNIIHGSKQDGITVYMSTVTIEGNEVYNSTSENGGIYLAYGISTITIQKNAIHDNTLSTGKWPTSAGILVGADVNAETVTINNNNIYNNTPYGVSNQATAFVNAGSNWWGNAGGPGIGGANGVSGNVNYTPWLQSPYTIQIISICGTPTLIELSSFTATPSSKSVIIEWNTSSEIDNAGFNLYRAESEKGNYVIINNLLIAGKGSALQGASYEFIDNVLKNRQTYYYMLEEIDISGRSTFYGPVNATPRMIYGLNK